MAYLCPRCLTRNRPGLPWFCPSCELPSRREAPSTVVTVALDYDGTFTAAPSFWRKFILMAIDAGHTVIMVTGRSDRVMHSDPLRHWGEEVRSALRMQGLTDILPVVFAGDKPKRLAAEQAGYKVDIWIDDDPDAVNGGR